MRTLIFDLDGTLTDPREGILKSYAHAFEKMGLPRPDMTAVQKYIGPPMREVFAELLGSREPVQMQAIIAHFRERFADVGLYENTPYDGIHETLTHLRDLGHPLLICTSKPRLYGERILEHFRLAPFFSATYGAEMDGTRGDKRELLKYLLEREKLDPKECVMIGDRMHDAQAAHANGTRSLGVLYGFGNEAELRAAGVHALCRTPRELPETLLTLGALPSPGDLPPLGEG